MSGPPILISVIVASYNAAPFIELALRSALNQTLRAVEVIVADDGSSDDTTARVGGLAATDSRLTLLPPAPNAGPAAARNRCLQAARGAWIAVLDADDVMHPERLERLLAAAERDGADMAADDLLMFDQDASVAPRPLLRGAMAEAPHWVDLPYYIRANTMFRPGRTPLGYLKPLIRAGALGPLRYNETLRIGEDYDLVARLLAGGARLRVYPELTYFYRRHSLSISHRLSAAAIRAMIAADEGWMRNRAEPAVQHALAERGAMLHRALAFDALVAALKCRSWARAATLARTQPGAAALLAQPLAARMHRLMHRLMRRARFGVGSPAPGHTPQAVVLSRQRVTGRTSGSAVYLLDLVEAVARSGLRPHLVCPSPAMFGRWPVLRLQPAMDVFAAIAVRGGWRCGRWLIATDPAVWRRAGRGTAGRLLARMGIDRPAWTKPAPYAIGVDWTRADELFVARHARQHGDLVIADYGFLAHGIAHVLRPDSPSLVVMHDLFSSRAAQFDRVGRADSVASLTLAAEMKQLALADAVIAIQPAEAAIVQAELPRQTVLVVPMSVRPVASPQPGTAPEVLFVGTKTAPNVVGLRGFLDHAWPVIRAAVPGARLLLCGDVGAAVGALPDGVQDLGYVDDLAAIYRRAAVVIAPLPVGSGLKIKLVEALGHGKAVVATEAALQGVPAAAAAAVWQADTHAAMAAAVGALLENAALRTHMAGQALDAARDCYTAPACQGPLTGFIAERVAGRGKPVSVPP